MTFGKEDMMYMTHRSEERGVALVTALLVVVLVGALILGVFATSLSDYRIGRNMLFQERALAAAEYGQNDVVRNWNTAWVTGTQPGNLTIQTPSVPGGGTDTVRLTRLNNTTFWMVSSGAVGSGVQTQGRRRTGIIVRLNTPTLNVLGAVTQRLTTTLTQSGSAYVSGVDSNPPWAGCGPTGPAVAGLALPDTNSSDFVHSSSGVNQGNPPILETPIANDTATYSQFGGITYTQLTSMANIIYAASSNASNVQPAILVDGTCDTSKKGTSAPNWGEPERSPPWTGNPAVQPACYNYFPVIWAKGKFQFSGGRGQGIILVDGDFIASGGTEFKGLIIVRGSFTTSGGGIKLMGAMFVKDSSTTKDVMSGSTVVQYSSCALSTVMAAVGLGNLAQPVRRRAWADMF
jgi:hypothetical protein